MSCATCSDNNYTQEELENIISNYISFLFPKGIITFVSSSMISNFNSTGLGTNAFAGWAICNGLNGTVNRLDKFVKTYNGGTGDLNSSITYSTYSTDTSITGTLSTIAMIPIERI